MSIHGLRVLTLKDLGLCTATGKRMSARAMGSGACGFRLSISNTSNISKNLCLLLTDGNIRFFSCRVVGRSCRGSRGRRSPDDLGKSQMEEHTTIYMTSQGRSVTIAT